MAASDNLDYLRGLIRKGEMLSVWETPNGESEFGQWLDSICAFRDATANDYRVLWLKFQDSLRKNKITLDRSKGNHRAISPNWRQEAGTLTYLLSNVLTPDLEAKAGAPKPAGVSPIVAPSPEQAMKQLTVQSAPGSQAPGASTPALSNRQRQQLALEQAFGKLHLLAVGIDTYSKASHFSNLSTCSADAMGIKEVFEDTHQLNADKSKLELLTSKTAAHPSRGNIILKLKELANGATGENRILYFHSGHGTYIEKDGTRTFYLVPEDAYADDDPGALLSLDEVKAILNKSEAKQKLIILDSCWSGPDTSTLKGPLATISPKFLEEYLRNAQGVVILSACAYDQPAQAQSPSAKYSLFTHFLIPALSGQIPEILDGHLLTLSGLSTHLSVQVQRTAKSHHHVQTPGLETSHLNEIIIGNFRAPIINTESWDPAESPADALLFSDQTRFKASEVLTKMKKWSAYSEEWIAKMVNDNLGEFLEERFGEVSAALCSRLGFNHREITPEGCSLKFPGGTYSVSYEASDRRAGALIHEVRLEKPFLEEPNKIPVALESIRIQPTEMIVDLSNEIDPLSTVPGLQAAQWLITSQLSNKVIARHKDGITLEFSRNSITFSGFTPRELWGDSTNKTKASLIVGAMNLIGRR